MIYLNPKLNNGIVGNYCDWLSVFELVVIVGGVGI
jgi:hypothetical protein